MTANIVILDLPPSTLVGIDFLCFTSSARFQGIGAVPPGWHLLFTSPTTSLSTRHGTWFFISNVSKSQEQLLTAPHYITKSKSRQSNILVFQWSNAKEELAPLEDETALSTWRNRLELDDEDGHKLRRGLFPYHQINRKQSTGPSKNRVHVTESNKDSAGSLEDFVAESTDWSLLTAHLSHELLERFVNPVYASPSMAGRAMSAVPMSVLFTAKSYSSISTKCYTLTTSSTSPEDRDDISGLSAQDARDSLFGHQEEELGFLGIDLKKTWRNGAVGRERTEGARDRSWALRDTVERNQNAKSNLQLPGKEDPNRPIWGSIILGEMELCFLAMLTLSNYSCLEEWKRVLKLVLTSYQIISSQPCFFIAFLDSLLIQLKHCDDVEGGLFEVGPKSGSGDGNFLRQLLARFKNELDDARGLVTPGNHGMEGENVTGREEVKEKMQELEMWLKEEWRWELSDSWVRRGMIELEDGEMVEVEMAEMEGEDERGEYAPVVVEM